MTLYLYGKIDDLREVFQFIDEYTGIENKWNSTGTGRLHTGYITAEGNLPELLLEKFPELDFSGSVSEDIEPDGSRWATYSFEIIKDENGNRKIEWDSSTGWH